MKYEHATWRPRRKDCSPPAIEQFPRPLMGPSARKHGGLIIHILVAIYTFLGLAIVCDDYFVSSLDRICEGNESFKVDFLQVPDLCVCTFSAGCCSYRKISRVYFHLLLIQQNFWITNFTISYKKKFYFYARLKLYYR